MASSRKPRPKTKAQMRRLVEEIVLTEEDETILDQVWDKMRRELFEKRKREKAQERKKKAVRILRLAARHPELRRAIVAEVRRGC